MKKLFLILSIGMLITATSCKDEKKNDVNMDESSEMNNSDMKNNDMDNKDMDTKDMTNNDMKKVEVTLDPKSDSKVNGKVVFTEENGMVTMTAEIHGLKEGTHAIHIHETADCSSADGKSAGGHWNPTNQPHGKWGSADGYHKGDIGNLVANAAGDATLTMTTDQWCIGCDDTNKNILNHAIIVHEGVDDFKTQPTGDAGGRVSCGGIIK